MSMDSLVVHSNELKGKDKIKLANLQIRKLAIEKNVRSQTLNVLRAKTAPEERYMGSKRLPDQILSLQRSVIFVKKMLPSPSN